MTAPLPRDRKRSPTAKRLSKALRRARADKARGQLLAAMRRA